jgi:hypothetical protein
MAISTRANALWATSFVVANPGDRSAIVEATLYGAGLPPTAMQLEAGPLSREALTLDQLRQLRPVTGEVSVELRSVNGVPMVVDRTLEGLGPDDEWRQSATGAAAEGVRWALADAWTLNGGALAIVNPSDIAATVRVRSYACPDLTAS